MQFLIRLQNGKESEERERDSMQGDGEIDERSIILM